MLNGNSAATVVFHDPLVVRSGFGDRPLAAASVHYPYAGDGCPASSFSRPRIIDAAQLLVDGLRLCRLRVARVLRRHGLDEGDQAFLVAHRVVHGAPGYDVEITGAESHAAILVFDA